MVTFWAWPLDAPTPMTETQHNKTSRFTFTVVPLRYLGQSLDNNASGFNISAALINILTWC